ncbi:transcriptional regulator, HxlR family [Promicromonospora umidemergens]|uniref:Helix-turn-helix domain-containing protein n=1 Tax=Promicromonospora umidemergens TaxID=629679 RepID=A0ABP8XCL6_9MICO|nr:helix-turn-helix domain-containing protein [Promicromonospora umidemergens]MCP2281750.1 transcriptional regulator, HxlR family [Promicromonospora umidemergens]
MELGILAGQSAAPKERDPFHTDCGARQVLDHVTSRWGVWVLLRLQEQPLRFYELRDHIEGISEKMLSQTLRNLAKDGLVWRKVEPTSPPQVTYGLTSLGSGLRGHLATMLDWIEDNTEPARDAAQPTL